MLEKKLFAIMLLVSCSAICSSQISVNLSDASIAASTTTPITTTMAASTTKATTPTESTTTSTTSTTASTSSTTTPPSTTTTEATTSTKATIITTTNTPITTGAPAPTSSPKPAPGPFPAPKIGHWNISCIALQFAAQLNFSYDTIDNKTAIGLYNIPPEATVHEFRCDSETIQKITLQWGPVDAVHLMTLQFDKKGHNVELTMLYITMPLLPVDFPNVKPNESISFVHRGADFDAPVKMSYHCTRAQKFNLTEIIPDKTVIGTITMQDVQVEAFRKANSTSFSSAQDCDSSESSDIVPIAVGLALVALISVVLISYLFARNRAMARGYMSF